VTSQNRVFLGGTCNESTWRAKLKPLLKTPYFDPVVSDWTEECIAIEDREKGSHCNFHLYVITSEMTGVYSIAEAVESVHNKFKTTFFYVIEEGFSESQIRSLKATARLIDRHGGVVGMLRNFNDLAERIDSKAKRIRMTN